MSFTREEAARSPLRRLTKPAEPQLRILCAPSAGSPASAFHSWRPFIPDNVELQAVQFPAREDRIADPVHSDLGGYVRELEESLGELDDLPLVLFGHSMGAIVAFEALRRPDGNRPGNIRLVIAGARAPHLQVYERPLHVLPNAEFRAAIVAMGGAPQELLEEEDLWELVEPCLRADIFAMETYAYAPGPDVQYPLHVLGGSTDSIASPPELAAWRDRTTGPFSLTMLEGGHFLPQERPAETVRAVLATLP